MIDWIKTIFDRRVWSEMTTQRMNGSGTLGGVAPRFNHAKAVEQFQSWVYIAANIVARECAQHPLRLYVRETGRQTLYRTRAVPTARKRYLQGLHDDRPSMGALRKAAAYGDDFVEVTEPHPAITTLCDPNPFLGGFDLTVLRWVYLQLTGNAYLLPVHHIQLGTPETVWPMPSQYVKILPDRETFIEGYAYGQDAQNIQYFTPDEVVHFKLPNPNDLYYGRGVLESIWSVWALHGHKRTMDLAHFENRARPDWIAAINGADRNSIERFEQAVAGKIRGSRKAGNMLTVGTSDFALHQLNFPPDVISDTDRVLDEIAGGFGVPRARITGNQSIAGGGSEQADLTFLRGTIAPLLKSDEETLNNQWLPLFGLDPDDAFLAYDNPVPLDREFERETLNQQLSGGRITINDANALEGLEPVEGGDVPRFNGVPLDQVGQMPPAPAFTFNAPQPPQAPQA
ncbi:MAG: phage portal protein, partial [Planctomycetota bacterium]